MMMQQHSGRRFIVIHVLTALEFKKKNLKIIFIKIMKVVGGKFETIILGIINTNCSTSLRFEMEE